MKMKKFSNVNIKNKEQNIIIKKQKKEIQKKTSKKEFECFDYNSLCLSYENENKNSFEKYQNEKSILFL